MNTTLAFFCRLCAELQPENHLINISSQKSINLDLAYKILHCCLIDLTENNNLPKHICTICCEKVISSYEFREQVQRAQEILKNKINDGIEGNNIVFINHIKDELDNSDYEIKIEHSNDDDQEQDEDDEKPLIQRLCERKKEFPKRRKSKTKTSNFGKKKKIKCDEFDKKSTTKEHLSQECHSTIEPENSFICDKCGREFKRRGLLSSHLKSHLEVYQFQCDECPKAFKDVYALRRHQKIHSDEAAYKCEVCLRPFKHRRALNRHARIHLNILPYECEYCKKCFREKSYLKIHLRQHTGEKPYSCTQCNIHFTNDSNFIKHLRGRHRLTNFSIANRHQFPFIN